MSARSEKEIRADIAMWAKPMSELRGGTYAAVNRLAGDAEPLLNKVEQLTTALAAAGRALSVMALQEIRADEAEAALQVATERNVLNAKDASRFCEERDIERTRLRRVREVIDYYAKQDHTKWVDPTQVVSRLTVAMDDSMFKAPKSRNTCQPAVEAQLTGLLITESCPACGHLVALHTVSRGCVGCELLK